MGSVKHHNPLHELESGAISISPHPSVRTLRAGPHQTPPMPTPYEKNPLPGLCDRLACDVKQATRETRKIIADLKELGDVVESLSAGLAEITSRVFNIKDRIAHIESMCRDQDLT